MFRKCYLDFLKTKASARDFNWIIKRTLQYFLIRASFLAARPLCGPIIGTFVTNYKCNYHCKMCDLPLREEEIKKKGLKELSLSQLKQLLSEFSGLGISGIGFTGGEPLLRSDIFELLTYSKKLGMITHLNTNGFFLDEKNAQRLIEAGVDSVNVSLDAANPKLNDSIRGHNGAFEAAIKAISFIDSARKRLSALLRLKVVAVINKENINEVEGLIRLSVDLGADCVEFIPRQNFTGIHTSKNPNIDEDFSKKIDSAVKYLSESKRRGLKIENSLRHIKLFESSFRNKISPLVCYAGYNSYGVDCYGEIYPCLPWINWGRSVGNVRDKSLKEFWYSGEYNKVRADIAKCRDCYLNCQAELNLLFN